MTASWIAYALLVGALLAATARWIESVCRIAGRPARWVWASALALTLGLAALAPHRASTTDALQLPERLMLARDGASVTVVRQIGVIDIVARAERATVEATQRLLARADRVLPARYAGSLGIVWLLASGALALLFGTVYLRFARARRHWPVAELHGERVRIAPDAGPAVVGLSRPEIVVPRWLLERSADEQRLVLVHEREHVTARDPLLLAAGCVAAALLPWNPAVWWMLSRLRLAVELDCDHRVLRRGVPRRSYGTLLIDLAGRCSGLPVGAPALTDRSSHLEQRLLAMLPNQSRFTRLRTGGLATLATLALLAACEAKMPTNADVAALDASKATATAKRMSFMRVGDSSMAYIVDGRTVSAADAQAVAPNQIASIKVQKKSIDGVGTSQIEITTRAAAGLPPLAANDSAYPVRVKFTVDANGARIDTTLSKTGELFLAGSGHDAVHAGKFDGVILIDGKRVDNAAMASLSPNDIVSMEVIKGAAAATLYDAPEAGNGVIKITTRKGKK